MLKRLTPILPVEVIEPALPFWRRLGFQETARVPEEEAAAFVMLKRDGIKVMIQTFAAFDEDGGALRDAEILIPRRWMFYGTDELVVRKPGGHITTFAEFEAQ